MTVLDAYALIAYLRSEPAADEVAKLLRLPTKMSTANAAEVIDQLIRVFGQDPDDVEADLTLLAHNGMALVEVTRDLAMAAGRLRARHYHRERSPISLADCLAAATALHHDQPLATSDPALAALVRAEGGTAEALPNSSGQRP